MKLNLLYSKANAVFPVLRGEDHEFMSLTIVRMGRSIFINSKLCSVLERVSASYEFVLYFPLILFINFIYF